MMALLSAALTAEGPRSVSALAWVERVLLGPLGTSLAVISVAWFGFETLNGRLSIRRGATLILGCFIFFGAPQIAQGLIGLVRGSGAASNPATIQQAAATPPAPPRNPSPYDPYAGAAMPNAQN